MLLVVAIVIFEAFSLSYLKIFLDQRAVLDIGRVVQCDLRSLVPMESYQSHRFAKYSRWVVLAFIFYFFGWKYVAGLYVAELMLMAAAPVPESAYREAMDNFRRISRGCEDMEQLYDRAEMVLRSKGIPV